MSFIYITCNNSKCFYLLSRWVENKKFADRLIAVLEDVRKNVQFWDKLTKSEQPNSRSYSNLKNSLDDSLIHAKLKFFRYIVYIIEPFLKKIQTDKPMVSFLFFELKAVVSELLEIAVKSSVIKS